MPALSCSGTWVAIDQSQGLEAAINKLADALPVAVDKLIPALQELFGFDAALFEIVLTACLVSWSTGHVIGRMMQAWRKVM